MNLQNIPRKDKTVKTAFGPKLDALLFFDYKQIEPRILAYYLQVALRDGKLAEAIRSGVDPYTAVIRGIYGREDFTDEERQVGKVLFLSQMYGGGNATICQQLGVTWQEAGRLSRQFHGAWPGVRMLQNAINARQQERGYIQTLWGRHLHPDSEHKSLNHLIQGCAADLMRASLVKVYKALVAAGTESHLVLTIHDELVADALESEIPLLVERVPQLMDEPRISAVVPIQVDVEISRTTWADKDTYQKEVALAA